MPDEPATAKVIAFPGGPGTDPDIGDIASAPPSTRYGRMIFRLADWLEWLRDLVLRLLPA